MKYYLTMVACILNEAKYLKEWIDFHLMVGFEHFYIYDTGTEPKKMPPNFPEYKAKYIDKLGYPDLTYYNPDDNSYYLQLDNPKEVLEPYVEKGLVTYLEHPQFDQKGIYNHAVGNYGKDSKWMSFLDLDEFVFPNNPTIPLKYILKQFERFPGLSIHSLFFGSSGQDKETNQGVIERFTYRASDDIRIDGYNDLTKTIAQPQYIQKFKNAHTCKYKGHRLGVNTMGQTIKKKSSVRPIYHNLIRLNHYHVKSKEEFLKRHLFGRHGSSPELNLDRFNSKNKICNQVKDLEIQKFIQFQKSKK